MKKYWRVFEQCIKNSFAYLLAYRADFTLKVFLGAGWSLTWIALIEIFFYHTDSFNGWSKIEVLFLLFTFQFLEITMALGSHINNLEYDIRHGYFDFAVIRPIDSQFFATFSRPDLTNFIFFLSYQTPILILLIKNNIEISWQYLPVYIFLILCANIIWLCIKTLAMTVNFWKQRLNNLNGLAYTIIEIAKYPMTIFPKKVQVVFYSFVPVAFIAFVPSSVLLGKISWDMVGASASVSLLLLILTRLFWRRAVKRYSSASS